MEDHIVEEIRRIRETHAAYFNYDVDAIFADLKRIESASGRPCVSLGPRKVEKPIPSAELLPTPVNK